MKKVINDSEHVVKEMVEGFMLAYEQDYEEIGDKSGIVRKDADKDKVGIIIGGGSGHEPLFLGFVGEGLADAAVIGNVFAAPSAYSIYEVTKALNSSKGMLYIYGNYAGDELNFDMAAELSELDGIHTNTVRVWDDVASAPLERISDRRGIAGDVFTIKVAGAAAAAGLSLSEVTRIAEKARDRSRSIGVALSPGIIPVSGVPTFTLADDEIEFGMGLHGEPGVKRSKMMKADDLTDEMMQSLFKDCDYRHKEVSLLVNGLGSTTLMELFIVNRRVHHILKEHNVTIHHSDVNNYCTCQEMGGFSISLLELDEELKQYYDAPAASPYYFKR